MNMPIDKNKKWIASVHQSIDQLGKEVKASIMKPAGMGCASDLLALCEQCLGGKIETIEDLVRGWNIAREKRGIKGSWEFAGETISSTLQACGCPLVRSGMVELHLVQCYCSQGMMETIFSLVAKRKIEVDIKRSIGRGDDVCEFVVKL